MSLEESEDEILEGIDEVDDLQDEDYIELAEQKLKQKKKEKIDKLIQEQNQKEQFQTKQVQSDFLEFVKKKKLKNPQEVNHQNYLNSGGGQSHLPFHKLHHESDQKNNFYINEHNQKKDIPINKLDKIRKAMNRVRAKVQGGKMTKEEKFDKGMELFKDLNSYVEVKSFLNQLNELNQEDKDKLKGQKNNVQDHQIHKGDLHSMMQDRHLDKDIEECLQEHLPKLERAYEQLISCKKVRLEHQRRVVHKIYECIQSFVCKGVEKDRMNLRIFETEHEVYFQDLFQSLLDEAGQVELKKEEYREWEINLKEDLENDEFNKTLLGKKQVNQKESEEIVDVKKSYQKFKEHSEKVLQMLTKVSKRIGRGKTYQDVEIELRKQRKQKEKQRKEELRLEQEKKEKEEMELKQQEQQMKNKSKFQSFYQNINKIQSQVTEEEETEKNNFIEFKQKIVNRKKTFISKPNLEQNNKSKEAPNAATNEMEEQKNKTFYFVTEEANKTKIKNWNKNSQSTQQICQTEIDEIDLEIGKYNLKEIQEIKKQIFEKNFSQMRLKNSIQNQSEQTRETLLNYQKLQNRKNLLLQYKQQKNNKGFHLSLDNSTKTTHWNSTDTSPPKKNIPNPNNLISVNQDLTLPQINLNKSIQNQDNQQPPKSKTSSKNIKFFPNSSISINLQQQNSSQNLKNLNSQISVKLINSSQQNIFNFENVPNTNLTSSQLLQPPTFKSKIQEIFQDLKDLKETYLEEKVDNLKEIKNLELQRQIAFEKTKEPQLESIRDFSYSHAAVSKIRNVKTGMQAVF